MTLYILAFEFAYNRIMRTAPSIKILVVGFTLAVLGQFQYFAKRNLATLCYEMCYSAGLRGAEAAFDYDVLVGSGALLFAAAFKSGGFDVDIALVLATRSQWTHVAWAGHVVTRNLVYIALTRASQRVWLFIEDLRKEVLATQQLAEDFGVTCVGEWRKWALQGILTNAQSRAIRQNADDRLNRSRSQMPWARLLHNTVHIWERSFTDKDAQTHIPPAVSYFCGDLVPSHRVRCLCLQRWVKKIAEAYAQKGWGQRSSVQRPATLWSHMSDSAAVRNTALTDPNCGRKMQSELPTFDVVQYYTSVGFDEAAADAMCALWAPYTLILTVHVNSNSIDVAVKVATFDTYDANFLTRALALKTHKMYGSGKLDIVPRKKRLDDSGEYGDNFFAEWNADRPAFVIIEKSHDRPPREVLHHSCTLQ